MAKKTKSASSIERKHKGTSAGRPGNLTKTSSMNKHKKRSFKIYRGQGRPQMAKVSLKKKSKKKKTKVKAKKKK